MSELPSPPDRHINQRSPATDIHLLWSSGHMAFLSDRWGDTSHHDFSAAGIPEEEARAFVAKHSHAFREEITFLVAPKPGSPLATCRLGAVVEFEIADDHLPSLAQDALSPESCAAWRHAVLQFAPALAHLADSIERLETGGPETGGRAHPDADADGSIAGIRCFFDLDAIYGGSLCVLLPPEAMRHYKAVADLLFYDGIALPPSAHARLSATRRLTWRPDPKMLSWFDATA